MSLLRGRQRRAAVRSYLRAARTRPDEGLRGALRALHPAPPTPAHVRAGTAAGRSPSRRQTAVDIPDDLWTTIEALADDGVEETRR
jgi:hypothetical protein